jgi:hypothetical protein
LDQGGLFLEGKFESFISNYAKRYLYSEEQRQLGFYEFFRKLSEEAQHWQSETVRDFENAIHYIQALRIPSVSKCSSQA